MDDNTFQCESVRAERMARLEPDRANYWQGYRRGLRRAYLGERFGTDAEHELWLRLAADTSSSLAMRGVGYRDGLAVLEPV